MRRERIEREFYQMIINNNSWACKNERYCVYGSARVCAWMCVCERAWNRTWVRERRVRSKSEITKERESGRNSYPVITSISVHTHSSFCAIITRVDKNCKRLRNRWKKRMRRVCMRVYTCAYCAVVWKGERLRFIYYMYTNMTVTCDK